MHFTISRHRAVRQLRVRLLCSARDWSSNQNVEPLLKLYNTNRTWSELLELANDLRRGDHKHDEMVISEWIKVIMTMWGHELNSRHEMEKTTVKGRMDGALFKQTMGYMKPLLKMLRKGTLSEDIRDSLTSMVKYIMQRDYILANERYMEMAIGNAPW